MLDEAKLARLVQNFCAIILDKEERTRLGPQTPHPEAREKQRAMLEQGSAVSVHQSRLGRPTSHDVGGTTSR